MPADLPVISAEIQKLLPWLQGISVHSEGTLKGDGDFSVNSFWYFANIWNCIFITLRVAKAKRICRFETFVICEYGLSAYVPEPDCLSSYTHWGNSEDFCTFIFFNRWAETLRNSLGCEGDWLQYVYLKFLDLIRGRISLFQNEFLDYCWQ